MQEMEASEIDIYLTHLAVNRHVAVNTQQTALNAIIFLNKQILNIDVGQLAFETSRCPKMLRLFSVMKRQWRLLLGLIVFMNFSLY